MFYTVKKLEARLNELEAYRYRDIRSLGDMRCMEEKQGVVNPVVPEDFSNCDCMKAGDVWKGRDLYLWLNKEIDIPAEWSGKRVVGLFDYGNTGAGNNSGFESLLYLDGLPFQGVDLNHKEVFFKEEHVGKTVNATFRLWSGLEGGGCHQDQEHKIKRAELAWLDERVDDLFYTGRMVLETVKILAETDPVRSDLKVLLDEAFLVVDWSCPGDEHFYKSVYEADELLNKGLEGMDKSSLVDVTCVGHTHIDVAWLWRLKHTREKCARSFSTVVRLMEQFPEYMFLQTQPQLYEYIKNDYPMIYEQMKDKIRDGQWEVDGGMWVEADCNLTSGESLTRQILLGSKFIKDEFDKDVEYLWLPDVFGYSWALPQILKKSGISMFMTTKISWNQFNRMPHDTFNWKGIDGSEVITHFITTPEPHSEPGSWFYTYNGQLIPKTVKGVWDAYSDKDINKELLISYGYGDGGGGVNRDSLEQRRRLDKIPGLPNVKTGRAGDYFKRLKETIDGTNRYVHTWDGELYLEYHRGTYTSQAYNKKMNRKMEFFYREAEWLSVMSAVKQGDISLANQEELTKGWKILLCNQFHDIIPGSSIREVYEDCVLDYEKSKEIAAGVIDGAYDVLLKSEDNCYTVVNNSNWLRDEVIYIENEKEGGWVDAHGKNLQCQRQNGVWTVRVEAVKPMGYTTIYFKEGMGCLRECVFQFSNNQIDTPFYHITWNEAGQITEIYDKQYDVSVIKEGERANVFQLFEDKPLGNEAWDIDIFYQEKMREVTDLISVKLVESGSLKAIIRMEWKYMNSTISQDMILYGMSRRIDFRTKVDYNQRRQLLKVAFPVDIRAVHATYDVQYGNVKRPTHWNTSWDLARFETVAQKWVDLSEHNYGVSLLNDSKYGHDIKDNVIRLTLLKAAMHPDTQQDQGEHEFTYSLLPHEGDFVKANTVQEAYALNQPIKVINGSMDQLEYSFITIDNPYVELDAVKQSEDGKYIVVRFHEFTGSKQKVSIQLGFDCKGYMESDLMERAIEELQDNSIIQMAVKPYEIKTILILL